MGFLQHANMDQDTRIMILSDLVQKLLNGGQCKAFAYV